MDYTINVHGQLMSLSQPQVMGILNVTPDSFFAGSRMQTEQAIAGRANQIVAEGATMIDVGGCSTRPGSEPVSEAEEMRRLRLALGVVRREPSVLMWRGWQSRSSGLISSMMSARVVWRCSG